MSASRYVARSPKVAARMVGDELMIMTGRDSTLFALNGTAALLWKAADGVTPLADIVAEHVCTIFDVELATAMRDSEEILDQLSAHGLVAVSDAPIAQGESQQAQPAGLR